MKIANGVTIDMKEAAQRTNIKGGLTGLYKLLKELKHFNPDNTPRQHLIKQGLFVMEPKRGKWRNSHRHRDYLKPWATQEGMLWLHEVVHQHGTTKDQKAA